MPTPEIRQFLNSLKPVAEGTGITRKDIKDAKRTFKLAKTLIWVLEDSNESLTGKIDKIKIALTKAGLSRYKWGFNVRDENIGFMDSGSATKKVIPPQAHEIVFTFSDGRREQKFLGILTTAIIHSQAVITADKINRGQIKALKLSDSDVKNLESSQSNDVLEQWSGVKLTHREIFAFMKTPRDLALELCKAMFNHRRTVIITKDYKPRN